VQIIVNTCLHWGTGIVMIQKPRKGWWYLPGGKVDTGETWLQAAIREVWEETGLVADGMALAGIHLVREQLGDGKFKDLRTIVQFTASEVRGELSPHSKEGILKVIDPVQLDSLPMNDGDRWMVKYTLGIFDEVSREPYFGKFTYNDSEELLDWEIPARRTAVKGVGE
jgi:8-oxo-dGTP diphosphatase